MLWRLTQFFDQPAPPDGEIEEIMRDNPEMTEDEAQQYWIERDWDHYITAHEAREEEE